MRRDKLKLLKGLNCVF